MAYKKGYIPWNKGKEHSKETKRKISEANKGKKHSYTEETKKKIKERMMGDKNPAKRPEVRKKISEAKKGKPHLNQRDENHYKWKGGVSILRKYKHLTCRIEYRKWRETVFARDNWTCQMCGARSGKEYIYLNAHHIKGWTKFPEIRYDIDNGITLCKRCHLLIHKK